MKILQMFHRVPVCTLFILCFLLFDFSIAFAQQKTETAKGKNTLTAKLPVSLISAGNLNKPSLKAIASNEAAHRLFMERCKSEFCWKNGNTSVKKGSYDNLKNFQGKRPLFGGVSNDSASRTISTNKVWPGGVGGFNLTGWPVTIYMWDQGPPRDQHQELIYQIAGQVPPFATRVTHGDVTNPTTFDWHATHVAGTLIASGQSAAAKGMAWQSTVVAYDWNNDVTEMTTALSGGMKISNHSYEFMNGWQFNLYAPTFTGWGWNGDTAISKTEDFAFGYYDSTARQFDLIANSAPEYMICVAAGNDRNDTFPGVKFFYFLNNNGQVVQTDTTVFKPGDDGPYDCIPRGPAVAKNVITVGSVRDLSNGYTQPSDIALSAFSSWGPTDDGRIKPDLVANGDSVLSCSEVSNSAYRFISGTSMACPTVTGSLALLQQYYSQSHGMQNIKSATLKAVAIHTADPPQSGISPTYQHGWGLMNTLKAAQLIQADSTDPARIQDLTLANGGTYSRIIYCDGTQPLKVTIAWNDPASGVLPEALDDPTARLVNDLDLRVSSFLTPVSYFPFVLNPSNPSAAATTGDNVVDNVEYIYAPAPAAGFYRVTVSHKGTLAASQAFSLVMSGYSTQCAIPAVTTLTPPAQKSGSPVTIWGNGFTLPGVGPGNNATFGTVAAISNTPASTMMMATATEGALYAPVSVTTGCGYMAQSNIPFVYTYPCTAIIDTSSLKPKQDFPALNMPVKTIMADLNGDKQPEMLVVSNSSGMIDIYDAQGDSGDIDTTFFPPGGLTSISTGTGMPIKSIAVDDITGDGKPEIVVVTNGGSNNVVVFHNITTVLPPPAIGSSSFGTPVTFTYGSQLTDVTIRDMDLDGLKDILVADYSGPSVGIFRNVNPPGMPIISTSFPTSVSVNTPSNPTCIRTGDINNDGKPEIILGNKDATVNFDSITVIQNQSFPGMIMSGLFVPAINFQAGLDHTGLDVGDIDLDGMLDIAVSNYSSGTFSVLLNTSTIPPPGIPGATPTLATKLDFGSGLLSNPSGLAIAAVDGNTNPDIVVTDSGTNTVVIFEDSLLGGGSVTLAQGISFASANVPQSPVAGDINRDGKPEIAFVNRSSNTLSILQNNVRPFDANIGAIGNTTICAGSSVTLTSTPSTPGLYRWWMRNDTIIQYGTMPNYPVSQTGTYKVKIGNSNGCFMTSPTLNVIVNPLPVVDAGPGDTLVFDQDTLLMPGFSPPGGTWSGTGVSSDGIFDPVQSGRGRFKLIYTFMDTATMCVNSDSAIVYVVDTTDAGIIAIDTIMGNHCSVSSFSHDVYVTLKNFGPSALLKCTIQWTVNSSAQTPYYWTGMLNPGETRLVDLGSYTFQVDSPYTIVSWTELPNDSVDVDHSNDTSTVNIKRIRTGLKGVYTISAGGNYHSFAAAVADLAAYGVCDTVLFRVSNGTFTEQVDIPSIGGASASNWIRFESANLDSSLVILEYGVGSNPDSNYVLRLNGADYITIRQITIRPAASAYSAYMVKLMNNADHNTITHNRIMGSVASLGAHANSYNSITYNLIQDAYYAIYFDNYNEFVENNNVIEFNAIDSVYNGIYVVSQQGASIKGNRITRSRMDESFGIFMYKCLEGVEVTRNKIELPRASLGIVSRYSLATPGLPTVISNNFVAIGDENVDYYDYYFGIEVSGCAYHNIYHNSVNLVADYGFHWGAALGCFGYDTSAHKQINVVNNIFATTGGARIVRHSGTNYIASSDYNDFYMADDTIFGSWNGNICYTISFWRYYSGYTFDMNSLEYPPFFASATDLHIGSSGSGIDNQGTPISSVAVDIDLQSRSSSTPDMGADEFSNPPPLTRDPNEGTETPKEIFVLKASPDGSGHDVKLNWQAVLNKPVKDFDVLRSNDEINWENIAHSQVVAGTNPSAPVPYHVTDADVLHPLIQKLVYKVRANHPDQSYTFSNSCNIITTGTHASQTGPFVMHQNISGSAAELIVQSPARSDMHLRLVDLQGRVVGTYLIPASDLLQRQAVTLDLQQLSRGVYLCEVRMGTQTQVLKLVRY